MSQQRELCLAKVGAQDRAKVSYQHRDSFSLTEAVFVEDIHEN
jgi:hypothetical protein